MAESRPADSQSDTLIFMLNLSHDIVVIVIVRKLTEDDCVLRVRYCSGVGDTKINKRLGLGREGQQADGR